MIEYFILFGLLLFYGITLGIPAVGSMRAKYFSSKEHCAFTAVTIIICARNEEKTIARCLKTILDQEYDMSKIQVIVINDASSDNTAVYASTILKNSGLNYRVISNTVRKGKKKSISFAMQFVEHELVITRDADTYNGTANWLKCVSDFFYENTPDMIIAPVGISENHGSLWALQTIENNVLQVLSCGSAAKGFPFLCSGANLAFTKEIFDRTKGYASHIDIASGDDVLFMEEVKKIPNTKILYLKSHEAVVRTYPCSSLSEIISQKVRWSSKVSINKNNFNRLIAVVVVLVNLGALFCLFNGFVVHQSTAVGLIFLGIKLLIDILLLFLSFGFLKNRSLVWYTLPIGLIYPIYACIIAVCAVFVKPKWK